MALSWPSYDGMLLPPCGVNRETRTLERLLGPCRFGMSFSVLILLCLPSASGLCGSVETRDVEMWLRDDRMSWGRRHPTFHNWTDPHLRLIVVTCSTYFSVVAGANQPTTSTFHKSHQKQTYIIKRAQDLGCADRRCALPHPATHILHLCRHCAEPNATQVDPSTAFGAIFRQHPTAP